MSDLDDKRRALLDAIARWHVQPGNSDDFLAAARALVAALDAEAKEDEYWTSRLRGASTGDKTSTLPSPAPSEPSPAPESAGAFLERLGVDGYKWAVEFHRQNLHIDTEIMIGWFCNAIEAGKAYERRSHEEMAERVRTLGMELERVRESARSSNERLREQRDVAMKSRSEMAERVRRAKEMVDNYGLGETIFLDVRGLRAILEGLDKEATEK